MDGSSGLSWQATQWDNVALHLKYLIVFHGKPNIMSLKLIYTSQEVQHHGVRIHDRNLRALLLHTILRCVLSSLVLSVDIHLDGLDLGLELLFSLHQLVVLTKEILLEQRVRVNLSVHW